MNTAPTVTSWKSCVGFENQSMAFAGSVVVVVLVLVLVLVVVELVVVVVSPPPVGGGQAVERIATMASTRARRAARRFMAETLRTEP